MIGVNNIRHGREGIQPVHISAGTVRMYHVCTLLYSIHLGYHFKICMLDPMLISLISHDNVMLGMAAHSHFHMSIWFLVLWTQPCSQLARENRRATSTSTTLTSHETPAGLHTLRARGRSRPRRSRSDGTSRTICALNVVNDVLVTRERVHEVHRVHAIPVRAASLCDSSRR